MISDKKLAGFSQGGGPMGGFLAIGYCFPLLFYGNFLGDKALMEGNEVVMGFPQPPPPPPLGKTMTSAVNMSTPLKYYKSKIFKHLTYR